MLGKRGKRGLMVLWRGFLMLGEGGGRGSKRVPCNITRELVPMDVGR